MCFKYGRGFETHGNKGRKNKLVVNIKVKSENDLQQGPTSWLAFYTCENIKEIIEKFKVRTISKVHFEINPFLIMSNSWKKWSLKVSLFFSDRIYIKMILESHFKTDQVDKGFNSSGNKKELIKCW